MRLSKSVLIAALALSVPALAQQAAAKAPKASYSKKDVKTVKATVKEIDQATRHVVLQTADGKTHEFTVGPQARNLAQVKVGDEVIIQYQEALEVDVTEADPTKPLPQPTEAIATERSEVGKKPEGAIARTVTLNGTVESVDMAKKTAVIKGSGGNTVEVKMQHPERWEKVKVGDTITAKYSEALALSVQPAAPKKGAKKAPAKAPAK
jgi:arginine repressor